MVRLKKEDPPKPSFKEKVLENHIVQHLIGFANNISKDKLSAFSSEAAVFTIISFFPFLMLFFVILSFTPLTPAFIMRLINDSFPEEIIKLIITVRDQLTSTSTTVISLTALTALWSASRGFMAIIKGFNVIYGVNSKRNAFMYRIYALLYTLGFAVLLALTLLLLGFGNSIYIGITKHFPIIKDLALLIMGMRLSVLLALLFFFFLLMYMIFPNRKSTLLHELPGAALAAFGWVGFSYGFAFYIDNIANFSYVYGSLTAIVLLLLWVYFCMFILFLGAEVNNYLYNYIHEKLKTKSPNSKLVKIRNFINSHTVNLNIFHKVNKEKKINSNKSTSNKNHNKK